MKLKMGCMGCKPIKLQRIVIKSVNAKGSGHKVLICAR